MEDTLARLAVLKYMLLHSRAVRIAGALVASGGLVGLIWKMALNRHRRNRLRHLRERKQEERRKAIEKLRAIVRKSNITLDRSNVITSLKIEDLLGQLKSGSLKATEVLHAFQLKALLAHDKTNCLIEPILEAEEWASELDHLENKGPLHGLPVSIKDAVGIKGYDSTIGCSQWIGDPFKDDAVVIKVLKKQGAIPFVKTNIPQTMMSWDSSNPIFGRVLNPHDLTRTSGGSSSGEGALIASGGSICGLGSDIGGSIRLPSSFCGICGLKPTASRVSKIGRRAVSLSGQNILVGSWGPMARDVDTLITLTRGLLDPEMFKLDSTIPVTPFRDEILKEDRKMRIGYFDYNEIIEAAPCIVRGVREARMALEAAGHELVAWNPGNAFINAIHLYSKSLFADSGKGFLEAMKYDKVDDVMKITYSLSKLPICLKKILAFVFKRMDPSFSKRCSYLCGVKDLQEWWNIASRVKTLQAEVISSWHQDQLDGIICPVAACPATTTGAMRDLQTPKFIEVASYSAAFNLLDFPGGCVPVTRVTKADENAMSSYPTKTKTQATLKKDLRNSQGLPVGVQVVTLPWQEEKCLRIMSEIERNLSKLQTEQ